MIASRRVGVLVAGLDRAPRPTCLGTVLVAALTLAGCALSPARVDPSASVFRVRAAFESGLNDDRGWAADVNEPAHVEVDRPFRIRFRLSGVDGDGHSVALGLQYRHDDGPWRAMEAHDFPYPSREAEFAFRDDPIGAMPEGWTSPNSASDRPCIVIDGDRVLRARATRRPVEAWFSPGWPITEFSSRVRIDPSSPDGVVFGFGGPAPWDGFRVELRPDGRVRGAGAPGGRGDLGIEHEANLVSGQWVEVEVERLDDAVRITVGDLVLTERSRVANAPVFVSAGFEVPLGNAVDFAEVAFAGEPAAPQVSIVRCDACTSASVTSPLLRDAGSEFTPAGPVSLAENVRIPLDDDDPWDTEIEWPMVIRRFADGGTLAEEGDLFEFRVVDAAGRPIPRGPVARVRATVAPGHVGGTFVETPGRIGPWQASNGDLYFFIEPTETDNVFMIVRSNDGGRTWREVDGVNRPRTDDLEAVDSRLVGDTIHVVHQVTDRVVYHSFRTSDHPTAPNTWDIRDEPVGAVRAAAQMAAMDVRSDGSVVAVFLGQNRLHYSIRSREGSWSPARPIDPQGPANHTAPQAVMDARDTAHIVYGTVGGTIEYRRLAVDGTLTPPERVAEGAGTDRATWGSVLPLVYLPESDTVVIAYRLQDGTIWARRAGRRGDLTQPERIALSSVVTDAVDSQQAGADVIGAFGGVAALFIDEGTRAIRARVPRDGTTIEAPVVQGIEGSWVRGGLIVRTDGTPAYGFVYDAGSRGGSGMNRYAEVPLADPTPADGRP